MHVYIHKKLSDDTFVAGDISGTVHVMAPGDVVREKCFYRYQNLK
jgi:hypothetical protein